VAADKIKHTWVNTPGYNTFDTTVRKWRPWANSTHGTSKTKNIDQQILIYNNSQLINAATVLNQLSLEPVTTVFMTVTNVLITTDPLSVV
jgi:hypothetical protein